VDFAGIWFQLSDCEGWSMENGRIITCFLLGILFHPNQLPPCTVQKRRWWQAYQDHLQTDDMRDTSKHVCPPHIVACVSYTCVGGFIETHAAIWRETVALSVILSRFDGKNDGLPVSENSIYLQWIRPERCVSTYHSRAGKHRTIDLERAESRTKDHPEFSPGNAASSVSAQSR